GGEDADELSHGWTSPRFRRRRGGLSRETLSRACLRRRNRIAGGTGSRAPRGRRRRRARPPCAPRVSADSDPVFSSGRHGIRHPGEGSFEDRRKACSASSLSCAYFATLPPPRVSGTNLTAIVRRVVVLPSGRFSRSSSCWTSPAGPTGITIRPPGL